MTGRPKNILFIMADQLRWDYLSCYGHPHLHTPNIDKLAARGVRFERAYCNAPICGPSRACFYTGRSMFSNGVYWNEYPLPVGEATIGDYLRPLGYRTAVSGKLHMRADLDGMSRLGIDPQSELGRRLLHGAFEPFDRFSGVTSDQLVATVQPHIPYNVYLRELGYDPINPWHKNANSGIDEAGNLLDGYYMRHNGQPANIAEAHSETPYTTMRAIECIEAMGDAPWCVHLSYIKPHWPYQAPAPYHNMYGAADMLPRIASQAERRDPHPVFEAFMRFRGSEQFARDVVRETIVPVYMGLVKQIDDQIGRMITFLEQSGQFNNTLIVFTSDHGDYLGDHWLAEKDLFHEPSVRIPLIIFDPSPNADSTRGTVDSHFVESIDLLPTFLEWAGGEAQPHRLEGKSLLPLLHGQAVAWRNFAVSEVNYEGRAARKLLGLQPSHCRGYMVRTAAWKYILWEGFAPQLFDMVNDPDEFVDLGRSADYESICRDLHELLFPWMRQRQMGVWSDATAAANTGPQLDDRLGVLIGYWSEDEDPFE